MLSPQNQEFLEKHRCLITRAVETLGLSCAVSRDVLDGVMRQFTNEDCDALRATASRYEFLKLVFQVIDTLPDAGIADAREVRLARLLLVRGLEAKVLCGGMAVGEAQFSDSAGLCSGQFSPTASFSSVYPFLRRSRASSLPEMSGALSVGRYLLPSMSWGIMDTLLEDTPGRRLTLQDVQGREVPTARVMFLESLGTSSIGHSLGVLVEFL